MDTNTLNYLDARLTNIETSVTLLLNLEKSRIAKEHDRPFDLVELEINQAALKIREGIQQMADNLRQNTKPQP